MADQVSTGGAAAAGNPAAAAAAAAAGANGGAAATQPITVDAGMVEWAKSKGYDGFDKDAATNANLYRLATSHRELEKFIGGDKIPLPKDMNDQAALRSVFEKLGTPKEAKDYKLNIPQGQNTEFVDAFRGAAHDANLTQAQAEKLNTWWDGTVQQMLKSEENHTAERAAADKIGLEKDWGGKMAANVEVADRARNLLSSELGIPRDKLTDGLEEVFGLRDASRILHFLGTRANVAGDSFEGGGHGDSRGGGGQIMSKEDAQAEKGRLFGDTKFAQSYRSGDASARAKIAELNNAIAAETQQGSPKVTTGNPGRR